MDYMVNLIVVLLIFAAGAICGWIWTVARQDASSRKEDR